MPIMHDDPGYPFHPFLQLHQRLFELATSFKGLAKDKKKGGGSGAGQQQSAGGAQVGVSPAMRVTCKLPAPAKHLPPIRSLPPLRSPRLHACLCRPRAERRSAASPAPLTMRLLSSGRRRCPRPAWLGCAPQCWQVSIKIS